MADQNQQSPEDKADICLQAATVLVKEITDEVGNAYFPAIKDADGENTRARDNTQLVVELQLPGVMKTNEVAQHKLRLQKLLKSILTELGVGYFDISKNDDHEYVKYTAPIESMNIDAAKAIIEQAKLASDIRKEFNTDYLPSRIAELKFDNDGMLYYLVKKRLENTNFPKELLPPLETYTAETLTDGKKDYTIRLASLKMDISKLGVENGALLLQAVRAAKQDLALAQKSSVEKKIVAEPGMENVPAQLETVFKKLGCDAKVKRIEGEAGFEVTPTSPQSNKLITQMETIIIKHMPEKYLVALNYRRDEIPQPPDRDRLPVNEAWAAAISGYMPEQKPGKANPPLYGKFNIKVRKMENGRQEALTPPEWVSLADNLAAADYEALKIYIMGPGNKGDRRR